MGAEASSEVPESGQALVNDQDSTQQPKKKVEVVPRVLLRGSRKSGKTALFKRLQGKSFDQHYEATSKVQSSSVNWSIRNLNEKKRVSVEIWDVVDKDEDEGDGEGESEPRGLAEAFAASIESIPESVTARKVLEVYKKTQAIVFVVSPYIKESFEYVKKAIGAVPYDIDVLISFGFKDLIEEAEGAPNTTGGAGQEVTLQDLQSFVSEVRSNGGRQITVIESSAYSGYGLRDLYKFLYLPFIRLQQRALFSKIQFLDRERVRTCDEIEVDNGNPVKYAEYMQTFEEKLRTAAERPKSTTAHAKKATSAAPPAQSTLPATQALSPASTYVRNEVAVEDEAAIAVPSAKVEEVEDSSSIDISEDEAKKEVAEEEKTKINVEEEEDDDIMGDINGAKAAQKSKQKWAKDESTRGKEGRPTLKVALKTPVPEETGAGTTSRERGSPASGVAFPSSQSGGLSATSATERGRNVCLPPTLNNVITGTQGLEVDEREDVGLDDFNPLSVGGSASGSSGRGSREGAGGLDDFLNSESVDSADTPAPTKKKEKAKPKVSQSFLADRDEGDEDGEIVMKPRSLKRAFGKPVKKPIKKSGAEKDQDL